MKTKRNLSKQERAARIQRLQQEIQKGMDSGPATPLTPHDWEELKRRARERAAHRNGQ